MNALSVLWKLRVDMLAILAAASPNHAEHPSESRLVGSGRARHHRAHSDISELGSTSSPTESGSESATLQVSVDDRSGTRY